VEEEEGAGERRPSLDGALVPEAVFWAGDLNFRLADIARCCGRPEGGELG
jgi:hypothetical protein